MILIFKDMPTHFVRSLISEENSKLKVLPSCTLKLKMLFSEFAEDLLPTKGKLEINKKS